METVYASANLPIERRYKKNIIPEEFTAFIDRYGEIESKLCERRDANYFPMHQEFNLYVSLYALFYYYCAE